MKLGPAGATSSKTNPNALKSLIVQRADISVWTQPSPISGWFCVSGITNVCLCLYACEPETDKNNFSSTNHLLINGKLSVP